MSSKTNSLYLAQQLINIKGPTSADWPLTSVQSPFFNIIIMFK